jgi:caffeoyl-CoA O-methyltransferase
MPMIEPNVEKYAVAHTSSLDPIYERLREETYATSKWPGMQVGPMEGRLLKLLTQLTGAKLAVEIGTFTGYSALSIAEGLCEDGRLITCDIDKTTNEVARRYFTQASWGHKIDARLGPALDTLRGIAGPLDFAFIDADKVNYIPYWEAVLPKMRPGGLIVADNVLWSGRVLAPSAEDDHAIDRFNKHVAADPRVEHVMLTVRDGMTLARKR